MKLRLTLLTLLLLLIGVPAMAQGTCTVSATSMAFGTYVPSSGVPKDTTATVTTQCSTLVLYTFNYAIELSAGSGGSFAGRRMASGASHLNYQIYTDAARSQVWGDGTSGTNTVPDSFFLAIFGSATHNYTAYGRLPTGQNITPGAYTDVITVLINY